MALTDTAIRSAKARDKSYRLSDSGALYLEVSTAGGKLWRLKYRFAGKEKRLALGTYPDTGLKEAREKRDAARKLLAAGIDPSTARKADRAADIALTANSFESIAREWLAVKAHEWTPLQHDKERGRLQNHAFPWIGKLPIAGIGVSDVRPLLDRVSKAGHLEQAHRLRFQLSRVFKFAIATERATRDPAADLSAVLPSRRKQNYAFIKDPKVLGALLRAIDEYEGTFLTTRALKLAPMLFCRPGELRAAEWAEFELDHPDGAQWVIPPERRKLKRAQKEDPKTPPHIVPLSTQALEILAELHPVSGNTKYLFPGARSDKRSMSDGTVNAALRRMGYDKTQLTGHGFRHTADTLLNELGYKGDAIEQQLSHVVPGVRGVYNKAKYMPARRHFMQQWADYLDTLKQSDRVAPKQRKV